MFIYNPSAGREEAQRYKERVIEVLNGLGYEVLVEQTEKKDDATLLAKQACEEKVEFLLAMGGDGTINEIVNGLAEQQYRPLFSFIPLGTVNSFARALGIPLEPEVAIEALKMTNTELVDIGQIGNKYFINNVAIGEIASRLTETSIEQKTNLGPLAYLVEGAKALVSNEEIEMTITHDKGTWRGNSMLILVSLTNSVGGFEKMMSAAKIDDGMLHVFIIKQSGLASIARMGAKVFLGTLGNDEGVEAIKTKKLSIDANIPVYCNVDGEEGDYTPLTLEVHERYLKMLIPKKN